MKKLILATALTAAVFSAPAMAEQTFKSGYVACLSKDLLDQFISASVDEDQRAMEYLSEQGCISPREGIPVSVLDRSWTGTAHVRAYVGDSAIELWTVREAITKNTDT